MNDYHRKSTIKISFHSQNDLLDNDQFHSWIQNYTFSFQVTFELDHSQLQFCCIWKDQWKETNRAKYSRVILLLFPFLKIMNDIYLATSLNRTNLIKTKQTIRLEPLTTKLFCHIWKQSCNIFCAWLVTLVITKWSRPGMLVMHCHFL